MPKKSPPKKALNLVPDRVQLLLQSPDFQDMVIACRNDLGIPKNGLATDKQFNVFIENLKQRIKAHSIKHFQTPFGMVEVLLRLFRIPAYYESFLIFYLLQGKIFPSLIEKEAIQIKKSKDQYGRPIINIQISLKTRRKEVMNKWSEVNKLQDELDVEKNNKRFTNINRDTKIQQLKKKHLSNQEIYNIINREFPEDQFIEVTHVSARLTRIKRYLDNVT